MQRGEDGRVAVDKNGEPIIAVRGLKAVEVNLYDTNVNLLAWLGAECGVAYSELFARGEERTPTVFLSHAWSHPLLETVEVLEQHAKDRGHSEDEPIWICAFAIRQHAVEIPALIPDSPFFKALKASAMTLIVISAVDMGVLSRAWCALEAFLAMVEGGADYLTDIYSHHEGEVRRLTDGLIESDSWAWCKADRDERFPFSVIRQALTFKFDDTKASVQEDLDNITAYVEEKPNGKAVMNSTVQARYFVAALAAVLRSDDGFALFHRGAKALKDSCLRRLVMSISMEEARTVTLVRSLPRTLEELRLPGVGIGDVGAIALGELLKVNASLTLLGLSENKIADAGAIGMADGLKVNVSLTTLSLYFNQITDTGAIGLAKALEINASLIVLWLNGNKIADAGAVGLAKGLKVNSSLTTLYLGSNQITDAGAIGLGECLMANASLTELWLGRNEIGDAGAIGFAKAFKVNASLTLLGLRENKIGDAGAIGMADGLEVNASLTRLFLCDNQIADAGVIGFARALEVNMSLTSLHLGGNKVGKASKSAIQTAWLSTPGREDSGLVLMR